MLAVDESDAAVARATANARRNGLANLKVERANSFNLLRALESRGELFDVVVIDPPALAKRGGDAALATAATAPTRSCSCAARASPEPGGLLWPARARAGSPARTGRS